MAEPELGPSGGSQSVEVKATVGVSSEQLAAYNALPAGVQEKLGPPVNGQVLSAAALQDLVGERNAAIPTSTIMCPW